MLWLSSILNHKDTLLLIYSLTISIHQESWRAGNMLLMRPLILLIPLMIWLGFGRIRLWDFSKIGLFYKMRSNGAKNWLMKLLKETSQRWVNLPLRDLYYSATISLKTMFQLIGCSSKNILRQGWRTFTKSNLTSKLSYLMKYSNIFYELIEFCVNL